MTVSLQVDGGELEWPALLIHGGAGRYADLTRPGPKQAAMVARLEAGLEAAIEAGWTHLVDGDGDPVAAVVAAVASLEMDGHFNAGRGSVPTTAATFEMDGAVMDDAGRTGAVTCLTGHSAVRAAEAVWRLGGPVILAGAGAEQFASVNHVPPVEPVGVSRQQLTDPESLPSPEGTVGAVAISRSGRTAAASSTGGRAGQIPGRVGDTPIPGAGLWAEPGCAVTATGTGEAFILAGFSRLVAHHCSVGGTVADAVTAGLAEVARYGGQGGAIALASDHTWVAAFDTVAMARSIQHAGGRRTVVWSGDGRSAHH